MSRSAPTNVKLTDFGTARAVTLTITKATQMTVGLGTPIYMVSILFIFLLLLLFFFPLSLYFIILYYIKKYVHYATQLLGVI